MGDFSTSPCPKAGAGKAFAIPNTQGLTDLDTWSILVDISKIDQQIYGDSTVFWCKVKHANMYIVKQADCKIRMRNIARVILVTMTTGRMVK